MQFEQQENPILVFVNSYQLSEPVKSMLSGGHKNAREMHIKIQELIIPERMAELVRTTTEKQHEAQREQHSARAEEKRTAMMGETNNSSGVRDSGSADTMRRNMKWQASPLVMRGPQDMHAGCFSDVRLAFEYVLALLRLQAVNEFEQISLECLAQAMYAQQHFTSLRRRALAAAAIAGVFLLTPWAMHKFSQYKKA